MALRANFDLKNALIKRYTVKSGSTIQYGQRVRFGTSDTEVDLTSGANDDTCFGTCVEGTSGNSFLGNAAGTIFVDVAIDAHQILPMVVGTGGSTRGLKQVQAANGVTDAPANADGTVVHTSIGIAMQTGVVGDVIGVMPINARFVCAT